MACDWVLVARNRLEDYYEVWSSVLNEQIHWAKLSEQKDRPPRTWKTAGDVKAFIERTLSSFSPYWELRVLPLEKFNELCIARIIANDSV